MNHEPITAPRVVPIRRKSHGMRTVGTGIARRSDRVQAAGNRPNVSLSLYLSVISARAGARIAGGDCLAVSRKPSSALAVDPTHASDCTAKWEAFPLRRRLHSPDGKANRSAGHCLRKFSTSFLPASVSTLSGWNCTPSTAHWRWRRPMMVRVPSFSVVQALTSNSAGKSFSSTMSE